MVQILHKSSYCTVFLGASHPNGPISCYKCYDKAYPLQARHWLNILRECCILSRLHEARVKGVVQLISVADTAQHFSLQFQACLGGNLYQALQRRQFCDEVTLCQKVIAPLLHVLTDLHTMGIIHRDIKPENIFFEADGQVVLGDFGLAIDVNKDKPCSRVGTQEYMAPEVLAQPSADMMALRNIPRAMLQPYTSAVDIWALGVLIHETLTGRTPFAHKDPAIMAFKAQYGSATKLPEHISQECQSFADMALQKSADKRPTAVALLSHPWIKKHAATNMAQVVNGHVRVAQVQLLSAVATEDVRLSCAVVKATTPVAGAAKPLSAKPIRAVAACTADPHPCKVASPVTESTPQSQQTMTGQLLAAEPPCCSGAVCHSKGTASKTAASAFGQRSVTIDSPEGLADQRSSTMCKLFLVPALSEPVLLESATSAAPSTVVCLSEASAAGPESLVGLARPAAGDCIAVGAPVQDQVINSNSHMLRGNSWSHATCHPARSATAGSSAAVPIAIEAERPTVPAAAAVTAIASCGVPAAAAYAVAAAAAAAGAQSSARCGVAGVRKAQQAGHLPLQPNKSSSAFLQKLRGSAARHNRHSVDIVREERPVFEFDKHRGPGMRSSWGLRPVRRQVEVDCTEASDVGVRAASVSSLLSPPRSGRLVKDVCTKIFYQLFHQGLASQQQ